ncbi:MAG TPA: aminotransferase class I/II-fold pyridoxal phosphate-dependent enzyme, partial [Nitrospiria bacterium]|nr:aminotransferase class I/II-fold pyridoxal phosphate-dependent enzyme [Nitrospiria bacterium]
MTKPFDWEKANKALREKDLFRSLRPMEPDPSKPGRVRIGGDSFVLMSSNDYLGFTRHPRIRAAATQALNRYGTGSGAARLLSGNLPPHRELEERTAAFKGTEAALVFSTGYSANLGLLSSIITEDALVLADRLCHSSLIDGCRLSPGRFRVFSHGNTSQIEKSIAGRRKP